MELAGLIELAARGTGFAGVLGAAEGWAAALEGGTLFAEARLAAKGWLRTETGLLAEGRLRAKGGFSGEGTLPFFVGCRSGCGFAGGSFFIPGFRVAGAVGFGGRTAGVAGEWAALAWGGTVF